MVKSKSKYRLEDMILEENILFNVIISNIISNVINSIVFWTVLKMLSQHYDNVSIPEYIRYNKNH